MQAVTVTQLNEYIKGLFSSDPQLASVCVTGEISNFKRHSTGHLYFTLKDEESAVSAVMFRGDAQKLRFSPGPGMKVIVLGRVGVYPKSGQYQVYVNIMQPDGIGALYMAFEQLKEKLYKMGYFDPGHKKKLPRFPQKIAIVTSPTGDAVRDMIRILGSRYPLSNILVCPVKVQGEGAASEIAGMIAYINKFRLADLIITGRGGGSLEDLWAFNEETVARAIYESEIPVISAVGHEPDVTISDYVADCRASTPSNAAEIAVFDRRELEQSLERAYFTIRKYMGDKIISYRNRLNVIAQKPLMHSPYEYFDERKMYLSMLEQRISSSGRMALERCRRKYLSLAASLEALSPLKVLARGYSMVSGEKGIIKSASMICPGDRLGITFADGAGKCTVDSVELYKKENDNG